jgi:hypothetical protein
MNLLMGILFQVFLIYLGFIFLSNPLHMLVFPYLLLMDLVIAIPEMSEKAEKRTINEEKRK